MPTPSSLHLALDLAQSPILAAVMRQQPVPEDTLTLIRLAGEDEEAVRKAVQRTGREASQLRAAAVFYIQQVLWKPDADYYRVLGASLDTDAQRLAEHMRFLMKWLHPDRKLSRPSSRSLARVLEAWEAVKTPERRRRYDQTLFRRRSAPSTVKAKRARPVHHLPVIHTGPADASQQKTAVVFWSVALASVALVAVMVMAPDWLPAIVR